MSERPQNRHLIPGQGRRKRGSKNKRTLEIESMAKRLLEDPLYRHSLKERLRAGEAPHMETLLHHYAYGKPTERVEMSGPDGGPLPVQVYLPQKEPAADA